MKHIEVHKTPCRFNVEVDKDQLAEIVHLYLCSKDSRLKGKVVRGYCTGTGGYYICIEPFWSRVIEGRLAQS